jgi:P2-related tail formation protein
MSHYTSYTERHVKDLLEVLGELLTVPELLGFDPDEKFTYTLEVMTKARVVRDAVLDELVEP